MLLCVTATFQSDQIYVRSIILMWLTVTLATMKHISQYLHCCMLHSQIDSG